MSSKTKNIIVISVIVIILIFGVLWFVKQAPSQTSSSDLTTSGAGTGAGVTGTANSVVAQNFLSLLLSVKSIKLDDSIFSDPAFTNLHDSSIVLTPDATTGRPNPFAPIGSDATVTPTTPTTGSSTPPAPTTIPNTTTPPAKP